MLLSLKQQMNPVVFRKAQESFAKADYFKAAELFSQLLEKAPSNVTLLWFVFFLCFPCTVIVLLHFSVQQSSSLFLPNRILLTVHAGMTSRFGFRSHYPDLSQDCEAALRLDSADLRAIILSGKVKAAQGDVKGARQIWEDARNLCGDVFLMQELEKCLQTAQPLLVLPSSTPAQPTAAAQTAAPSPAVPVVNMSRQEEIDMVCVRALFVAS